MEFICSQCGLCCRNIGEVDALRHYHDGDGICRYLDQATNLCTIYENRPDICNVQKSYLLWFSNYTEDEYLRMNYEGCERLWGKKSENDH